MFVAADYSQIEPRVLAHFCGDQKLLQLFHSKGDVYKIMASIMFSKDEVEINQKERNVAKTTALGLIYGQGVAQMAKSMNVTDSEAYNIQNQFFRCFPRTKAWMNERKNLARKQMYVETILKFRRSLPDINSSDTNKRATAERQAINTIVQGSAADVIKLAMVMMDKEIDLKFSSSPVVNRPRLALCVHDELVYEVERSMVNEFVPLLVETMETKVGRCLGINMVLFTDVAVGESWGDLSPMEH